MTNSDEFRKLFDDVGKENSESEKSGDQIDDLLTNNQSKKDDGFEKMPFKDNLKKMTGNLELRKDDIGGGKSLYVPDKSDKKQQKRSTLSDAVESAKGQVFGDYAAKNIDETLMPDQENSDKNDSNDVHSLNTDINESEKKASMNLRQEITTNLEHFKWNFDNSSPKLNTFYEEKERLVHAITQDKIIPFDAWKKELKNANGEISDIQYDQNIVQDNMIIIQQWRDRVQEMLLDINTQYVLWKRFIELLRGYLAQVAYEKPVEKFRGVIYHHMGDVEMYFGNLEAIREDAEGIMNNLNSVFNLLSRQLTLIMHKNEIPTRYDPQIVKEHIVYEDEVEKENEKIRMQKGKFMENFDGLCSGQEKEGEKEKKDMKHPDKDYGPKVVGWNLK